MRYLWLVVCVLLVACGSDDKTSEPRSYALNGFWNGQLDQGDDLRMLVYNGEVFARDAQQGYYGTLTYNDYDLEAKITLSSKFFTEAEEASNEFVSANAGPLYTLTGLYYQVEAMPQLIGDYSSTENGSFKFENDGTWKSSSSLTVLSGKWQSHDAELYIQPNTNKSRYEFRKITPAADINGCTYNGEIILLNSTNSLYQVNLKERKNCLGFNRAGQGYAAVNAEGELEFYLSSGSSLLFMTFQPSSGGTPSAPNPDPNPDPTPDEDDETDPDPVEPPENDNGLPVEP